MINLRQAKPDEVRGIQDLNDLVFADNVKYDPDLDPGWAQSDKGRKYFTDRLSDPTAYFVVAEEGGRLVGYANAQPIKEFEYREHKYVEIDNLGVIPEYRRQGIASKLLDECLSWAKGEGYEKVYLQSYAKNTGAREFYKKLGYHEIDIGLEKDL